MPDMSEDLSNEIEAINSIYDPKTLQRDVKDEIYILSVPNREASLRLSFSASYPREAPRILGTERTGSETRKGYGDHVLDTAQQILKETFTSGSVCLFDLIQELEIRLGYQSVHDKEASLPSTDTRTEGQHPQLGPPNYALPRWYLSHLITEKKSTFIARTTHVQTPSAVRNAIAHLLSTDKRVAKATHNITAYRMRDPRNPAVTYLDCDDDGETAAGGRLLHLLQAMDVWDVLVVVSRWFGGVKLGPDRFRLINQVAREAVVEGKWMKSKEATT